jgi:hypothetical protein
MSLAWALEKARRCLLVTSEYYLPVPGDLLGRVTSGLGGDLILSTAKTVLQSELPDLLQRVQFRIPDEKDKRRGQAIAAASLPQVVRK